MHGLNQMIKLKINRKLLEQSLQLLKGSPDRERVVLWLGKFDGVFYVVSEVFLPIQITEADHFWIPPEGMREVMQKIKTTRTKLIAQVHTHPFEAFHSRADDKWAIVRHQNAYSLVLPVFCSTTNTVNFTENVATFTLNSRNIWQQVKNSNIIIE